MGSFDGAEICELVGLYALNKLRTRFDSNNIGLYRDDGSALIKGTSPRLADKARKDLCSAFQELGLNITAEVNNKTVYFLDVTLIILLMSHKSPTDNQITTHCTFTKIQPSTTNHQTTPRSNQPQNRVIII